jgi:hypothetical protein
MWFVNYTKHGVTDSVVRYSYWKAFKEMWCLYIGGADTVVIEYVPTR